MKNPRTALDSLLMFKLHTGFRQELSAEGDGDGGGGGTGVLAGLFGEKEFYSKRPSLF